MDPIKQWVNIKRTDANFEKLRDVPGEGKIPEERCGPVITLTARINRKKKGKRVFWGVELGPNNLEKTPTLKPGWAKRTMKGGFGASGFYQKLAPTDENGVSTAEFQLSECGGDEFTVKAFTKTAKGKIKKELKSEKYVVWRQLYYQVTRMRPSTGKTVLPAIPDIDWTGVSAEYGESRKPHNLRWTATPAKTPLITRKRCLYTRRMSIDTGLEGYDRDREPLVLKVSLVDLMADRVQQRHELVVPKPRTSYEYRFRRVLFDENSPDDRTDWLVSFSAHMDDPGQEPIEVKREHFSKAGPATIRVTVPRFPRCSGSTPATVVVTLRFFTNWKLGRSWYNGIWAIDGCAERPAGAPTPTIVQADAAGKVATMVHELGHAIGMVPPGSAKHYVQHGHVGNHCWNGATDPSTLAGPDTEFPTPSGAICTMFGDSSSNTEKFCDVCSPFVRSLKPSVDGKLRAGTMMPADPTTW